MISAVLESCFSISENFNRNSRGAMTRLKYFSINEHINGDNMRDKVITTGLLLL